MTTTRTAPPTRPTAPSARKGSSSGPSRAPKAGSARAGAGPSRRQGSTRRGRGAKRGGRSGSPPGGPGGRSIFWRHRRWGFAAILVAVAMVGGAFMVVNSVELPEAVPPAETSFVCLADVGAGECGPGNAVAQYASSENRIVLRYEDMPRILVQAVLAAEDRNYFAHSGIDPVGITRALYQDLTSDGNLQGGSTITQQYVKTVFLSSERTVTRKLKEAALAIKLERELSKKEILERYLNVIYFGRGAYGVEAASRAYFDKPARELQLEEAALLAGLIRAPEKADPTRDPDEARRRRQTVLAAMVETGDISREEAAAADDVPFEGHVVERAERSNNTSVSPEFSLVGGDYLAEWVRQELSGRFGEGAAYTEGLRVYLTIEPAQQVAAFGSIVDVLDQPGDPAAALVSVDEGGRIVSMVGGRDYAQTQVNFALGTAGGGSGRPPGSTFKPFALAAYVEQGNSLQSVYPAPAEIVVPKGDEGKDWKVANYEDEDAGTVTVEEATWRSVNTAYVQILEQVGPQAVADAATRAGVSAPVPAVNSVVLGTPEVSVLDMASAYSTFANGGVRRTPYMIRRVESADGEVLFDQEAPTEEQVFAPEVAETVTNALRGVIDNGSGRAARLSGRAAAGKTGTTNDYKDAWFAGYTCHRTTVVWVGYEVPREMTNVRGVKVAGSTFPAEIWHDYMSDATQADESCTYPPTDAGQTKLNPDLVAGPPTTTTIVPPPSAPAPAPEGTEPTEPEPSPADPTTPSTTIAPPTSAPPPSTVPPAPAAAQAAEPQAPSG